MFESLTTNYTAGPNWFGRIAAVVQLSKASSLRSLDYREFNDQLYGGTKLVQPYSCARIDIDACFELLFPSSESLTTNYTVGAIGSARIAGAATRNPKIPYRTNYTTGTYLVRPYSCARIGGVTTKTSREGTSNLKTSIYSLSSTSKLSQNLKGSSPLLNFV